MKITFLFFLILNALVSLHSQSNLSNYKRAKVSLSDTFNITKLASLGIDVEHGDYQKHSYFISDFSVLELAAINSVGFKTTILIEDVIEHYINQVETIDNSKNGQECLGVPEYNYIIPQNFKFGSMSGYFTYQEMLNELDSMASKFPNLISIKKPIENHKTYDNNSIYWVQISDTPEQEEEKEPQVLYTALHHAREPISLSQLIYFMWYMLEHYEKDETIKYIIDNTAMYFIPCINPDGYQYNQLIRPNGGGLWRKNKRDSNGNGRFDGVGDGVDLNRNYGFEWGYNDIGSSSNPNSDTYRGPSAFSEPETQAIQFFCQKHNFKLALNYHAYGDLLIYPWGYTDELTSDGEHFVRIGNILAEENQFLRGTAIQTVGYNVNGVSDDWMYQVNEQKPNPIFAMTPEVGASYLGFWPPRELIPFLCQSTIQKNIMAAHIVHPYPQHKEMIGQWLNNRTNELIINVSNIGLEGGYFSTSIKSIHEDINIVDTLSPYFLAPLAEKTFYIPIDLGRVDVLDTLLFEVATSNGIFIKLDTIVKIFQPTSDIFKETFDDQANWITSSKWGITDRTYYSANSSLTDSPNENYTSNQFSTIILRDDILLKDDELTQVRIQYKAKWELEPRYDNILIQISFDDINYIPICGKYSVSGGVFPVIGQPVYNGFQPDWIFEDIDITDLVLAYGELDDDSLRLRLKIQFTTDSDQVYDGFYIDDLIIQTSSNLASSVYEASDRPNVTLYPNPAKKEVMLILNTAYQDIVLNIYDSLGRNILKQQYINSTASTNIDLTNFLPGIYFVECILDEQRSLVQKLIVAE